MSMRHAVALLVLSVAPFAALAHLDAPAALPGTWIDERGSPFALGTLRGSPVVLTMAYGACRRICATSLRTMERLQQQADRERRSVQFVVVGLDPRQDRPADWLAWRDSRGLARGNWHFLTGSEAAVRHMADALGVRYWHYGEHVMHDYRIVVWSSDGALAHELSRADDMPATLPR